jgi:hypothetical protein
MSCASVLFVVLATGHAALQVTSSRARIERGILVQGVRDLYLSADLYGVASQLHDKDTVLARLAHTLTAEPGLRVSATSANQLRVVILAAEKGGLIYYSLGFEFFRVGYLEGRGRDGQPTTFPARVMVWDRASWGTVGRNKARAGLFESIDRKAAQFLTYYRQTNAGYQGRPVMSGPVNVSSAFAGVSSVSVTASIDSELSNVVTNAEAGRIVENELKRLGVPVDPTSGASLAVTLDVMDQGGSRWAYLMTLELMRVAMVPHDGRTVGTRVSTWKLYSIDLLPKFFSSTLKEEIRSIVLDFVKEQRKHNPVIPATASGRVQLPEAP